MTYIITGASSDIGIEFLKSLENDGKNATVCCQYYSDSTKLYELKNQFRAVEIIPTCCDLSSIEDTDRWISELKLSGILPTHILHLAAQKFEYMRIKNFDWSKTVRELNIQVNSLAQLFKAFLPAMSKAKYGRIAAVLSSYTLGVPPKFMSDYVISKYALSGLLKSAASEYSGTGIVINGLSPSMIETKFLSNIDERIVEMSAQSSPMKRNVEVREVVHALKFLLSDRAGYINGTNLNLSGGEKM